MEYSIFPAIGIARLGNSAEFFVGPEVPGSLGRELGPSGETEVTAFADAANRKRRQAARFHLYQRATTADPFIPVVLPAGAKVRWTVRVVNKKDAIQRPTSPPGSIPAGGLRPKADPSRANRIIDSGNVQIEGAGVFGKFLDGTHDGDPVRLGELRTDAQQRLLFLGANGISKSKPVSPIGGSFYNNRNWHDDVADGPVEAEVMLADGTSQRATSAWVIVGPPDFSPSSLAIVTLYDEVFQVAVSQGWLPNPTTTSFTKDIFPLLQRARSLRWSHGRRNAAGVVVSETNWNSVSADYAELAKADSGHLTLRTQNGARIRAVEGLLSDYRLTPVQKAHLTRWESGTFNDDWTGLPPIPPLPAAESLTRSALEGTVGQGFFPGIEGGRILTDRTIYSTPFDFRIDSLKLTPGDVTALMAQPWQVDFLKCSGDWWPSQRPDIAPQANGSFELWARLGNPPHEPTHQELVDHVMQFGVVVPKVVGGLEVAIEEGRDPAV
jgi:hypothetical protein